MTTPEQRRDAWDRFAAGYDEAVTPFSMPIAEDALRRVDIRPGIRFLDVASGGGASTSLRRASARRYWPQTSLLRWSGGSMRVSAKRGYPTWRIASWMAIVLS
jgi:hypothetical protein